MQKKYTILLLFIFTLLFSFAQNDADTTKLIRNDALNIYIDCNGCDQQYFKENFTIVNYVRDRKEADVHILVTQMQTGGGGREFSIQFIGRKKFSSLIDTIVFNLHSDYTSNEKRIALLKNIQFGLIPYILKTKYADKLQLTINSDSKVLKEEDPWKNWVFRISANGWGQVQKSYTEMQIRSELKAQKVTPDIKVETSLWSNYQESKVRLYTNDTLVYSSDTYQRTFKFSNLIVKSVGDHFGVGGFFNIRSSTYQNLEMKINVSPAIEYNVFKYSEASSKQLRFLYSVGYIHFNYFDTTYFNKTREGLFNQELRIMYKYVAKWGSLDASVSGSTYLNDFSLYSIDSFIGTEIRLFKGLSLNFWGGISIPRDQIELRKGNTSAEDALTKQHEMQTDYNLWINGGISYTFGSIYNNVVNPRFN